MHSCDESLFLALNFDGGPCLDRIMTLISGMAIWIPFYLLILWLVCRRYGWRNTLLFLAALALALVLSDMLCGIFKHSGPLKHLWADFPPRWRPMFSPALEGLDIPADSLFAWRHAGLPTPNSLVHVPAGAVAGKYGTVSSHAATIAAVVVMSAAVIRRPWVTWLGGAPELYADAKTYFAIFCLGTPAAFLGFVASSMLRSTGNVKLPSMINIGTCFLDAIFNLLLIFPTATYKILGLSITVPGADLGVAGAALGTILAELVSTCLLLWFLVVKSDKIALVGHPGSFLPEIFCMRRVLRIGSPIAVERMAMSGAQIVTTMIVAPLGPLSLAAHSFAITAESLCYMPGYGVADAASTIVGQSIGAKRPDMARRFAKINVIMVMVIMSAMGVVMYLTAPWMIGFMTTNQNIIELGSSALRIEAFAEPMFAAAIVSCSIFVSAGFTLFPSLMNLGSMWLVRIPMAYYLASRMGLDGVWVAMAFELCFRGAIFLIALSRFDFSKRRGIED